MTKKKSDIFDGRIWPNILDFNHRIDTHLTSKANFLFGASTIILVFLINSTLEKFSNFSPYVKISMTILLIGSFISSMLSMMIVLPRLRIFSRKERVKQDIFWYKNVQKFYTRKQYETYLKDLPLDNARIGKAYANQIYSLSTKILPYKFKMLKLSGWTLVLTLFFSVCIFIIGSF
jgi:hypothetical protein